VNRRRDPPTLSGMRKPRFRRCAFTSILEHHPDERATPRAEAKPNNIRRSMLLAHEAGVGTNDPTRTRSACLAGLGRGLAELRPSGRGRIKDRARTAARSAQRRRHQTTRIYSSREETRRAECSSTAARVSSQAGVAATAIHGIRRNPGLRGCRPNQHTARSAPGGSARDRDPRSGRHRRYLRTILGSGRVRDLFQAGDPFAAAHVCNTPPCAHANRADARS
jgi:hypothetical protein